jgi:glycosyltransferase involved in cell wall biosynthesis
MRMSEPAPTDARPRVVIVHNFLSAYRVELFTELARRFDLDVWLLGDVASVREWRDTAPADAFRRRVLPRVTLPLGSRYNALLLNPTLSRELRRARPDCLIVCGWDTPGAFAAARAARKAGIPLVVWSGSTAAEDSFLRRVTLPLVRRHVALADAWLAYGTRARDYLASLGADPDRTFLAWNTVDLDFFARRSKLYPVERKALRDRLDIRTPDLVLYCGNLLALKGLDDLLQGFAQCLPRLPGLTLVLAGSGRERRRFETLAKQLGISDNVRFAGYVPREELPAWYGLADLLVLPSRSEVWGLVINEALACGVPAAASTAAGATADLVRDGENGYVFPPRDPAVIAAVFDRHFALSPGERAVMRERARASIAPFTVACTADAFEESVRTARGRR